MNKGSYFIQEEQSKEKQVNAVVDPRLWFFQKYIFEEEGETLFFCDF